MKAMLGILFLMLYKVKFSKILGRCLADDWRKLYKFCLFIPSLIDLSKKFYESLSCYLSGTVPGSLNIKMKIIQYLLMGLRVHAR